MYSREVAPACTCPRASDSVSHSTPSTLHPHHTPTTYSPEIGSKMSQACISECGHAHQHVVTHTRVPTCTHCTQTQQNTHMHENTCTHGHTGPYTQDNHAHVCSDTCASTQAHIRPSVHAYTRAHTCTRTGEKFAAPCAHPKMHTALCRASGGRFGALKVSASGSYPPPAICAPRTARWPSLHLANRVRASSIFWSESGPSYGSGPGARFRDDSKRSGAGENEI